MTAPLPSPVILSIQSHVAYGYVGNRAAVFPLQNLGIEVIAVDTVQFSNHTGYGAWTGQVFDPAHLQDIIDGLFARGAMDSVNAVLSGYLGSAALGTVIKQTLEKLRNRNPDVIYCCDPVMGDTGRGFFVPQDIAQLFRDKMAGSATIVTPNQFELGYLTGRDIHTRADALAACDDLHRRNIDTVLLTSMETVDTKPGTIEMLASGRKGRDRWQITTPKLPIDPAPNGAGDMTAALFTGHRINGKPVKSALEHTASAVYSVFETTRIMGRRELALIQSQKALRRKTPLFKAEKVKDGT